MLAACGFQPLYGNNGNAGPGVGATLSAVYVEQIPDRVGYELRNDLLDRLDALVFVRERLLLVCPHS